MGKPLWYRLAIKGPGVLALLIPLVTLLMMGWVVWSAAGGGDQSTTASFLTLGFILLGLALIQLERWRVWAVKQRITELEARPININTPVAEEDLGRMQRRVRKALARRWLDADWLEYADLDDGAGEDDQAEPNEGAPPVAVRVLLDELLAYVDLGGPCMVERAAHLDSVGLCGAEYGFTVTATHQRTGERTDIDILVPYGLWMKPNARFLFHGRRHAWVESIDGLREHFGKQERFGRPEG